MAHDVYYVPKRQPYRIIFRIFAKPPTVISVLLNLFKIRVIHTLSYLMSWVTKYVDQHCWYDV